MIRPARQSAGLTAPVVDVKIGCMIVLLTIINAKRATLLNRNICCRLGVTPVYRFCIQ